MRGDTDAFEEVVSDLYDGFLSAEDREGVKPPDYEKIPALVKWGNKEDGPYTLVPDLLAQLGIKTAIVSMPPGFAQTGIVGYTTLGHETTGHDILHADIGLLDEIEIRVKVLQLIILFYFSVFYLFYFIFIYLCFILLYLFFGFPRTISSQPGWDIIGPPLWMRLRRM